MLHDVEVPGDVLAVTVAVSDASARDAIRVARVRITGHVPLVRREDAHAEDVDVEAVANVAQKPCDAALVRRPGVSARPTLPVPLIPVCIIVILKVVERPHETLLGVGLSN